MAAQATCSVLCAQLEGAIKVISRREKPIYRFEGRRVKTLLWLFFLFRQQPFLLLGDKAVWQKHKPFLSKDEVVTANNVPAFPKDIPMLSIYEVILQ